MKIVISVKHGGFGLSKAAFDRLLAEGHPAAKEESEEREKWKKDPVYGGFYREGSTLDRSWLTDIPRDDPSLVRLVEEMGEEANGCFAKLKVVEIPDGVDWEISEYDGWETIAEKHRTWC
jgi:hypothetical protein